MTDVAIYRDDLKGDVSMLTLIRLGMMGIAGGFDEVWCPHFSNGNGKDAIGCFKITCTLPIVFSYVPSNGQGERFLSKLLCRARHDLSPPYTMIQMAS